MLLPAAAERQHLVEAVDQLTLRIDRKPGPLNQASVSQWVSARAAGDEDPAGRGDARPASWSSPTW